ncbi:MAG: hypothetical protein GF330_10910 [Candidatus Eisenbacteria bacterium]|nr:hypothetical protein [Candidatus Eisenbacteria bacterium]
MRELRSVPRLRGAGGGLQGPGGRVGRRRRKRGDGMKPDRWEPLVAAETSQEARGDRWLLWGTLILSACGLLMVYSSSCALGLTHRGGNDFFYLQSQLLRWGLGVGILLALRRIDAHQFAGRFGWLLWGGLIVALLVLILPIVPIEEVRGTRRFLPIGVGRVQPSEFARMAMVVCLAGLLSGRQRRLRSWRGLAAPVAVVGLTAGLIAAEPHMSLGLLTAASGFLLIFLAGASLWRLGLLGLLAGGGALLLARAYQWERVARFFSGTSELGYQAYQSKLAIGSGGIWGLGLGRGFQKYFFLPDPHTDFILSVVGEEAGLIGLLVLFGLTALVIARIFRIGRRSHSRFAELLAYGIGVQFALAALLHAAVCLVVAPTTGVPFPLISFGGSALVAHMMGLGLVLSLSRRPHRMPLAPGVGWAWPQSAAGRRLS